MEKTQQQLSQPLLSLPKFQTADEFTRLTLGIEKMESIISFTAGETVRDTIYAVAAKVITIRKIPPGAEVRVIQCGDGNRPDIQPLLPQYYIWLQAAAAVSPGYTHTSKRF